MRRLGIIGTAAVWLIFSSTAQSQNLADVARQERNRRTGLATRARVITNDDFKNGTLLRAPIPEKPSAAVQTNAPPVVTETIQRQTIKSPPAPEHDVSAIPQSSYVVQPGDTLWHIAEVFLGSGQRWREIQKSNGLVDDRVRAGDRVHLPATAVVHSSTPRTRPEFLSYKVQPGESLWRISETVLGDGASWRRLLDWNPQLDPNKPLRVGQFLFISDEVLVSLR